MSATLTTTKQESTKLSGTGDQHDQSPRWYLLKQAPLDGKEESKLVESRHGSRCVRDLHITDSTPTSLPPDKTPVLPESVPSGPTLLSPLRVAPLLVKPVLRTDEFRTILSAMRSPLTTEIKAVFGTSVSLPASGSGFVNAVLAINLVAGLSEFSSYASLYGEFFVTRVTAMYQPQSMYGAWPAAAQAATGQPLAVVSLHHGITAATTIALASSNASVKYAHSSQPWKYTWRNIEDPKSKVVISPVSSSAIATQAWCLSDSTSAGAYTGQIHMISPVTLGTAASQQLGNFLIRFEVLFRNRQ